MGGCLPLGGGHRRSGGWLGLRFRRCQVLLLLLVIVWLRHPPLPLVPAIMVAYPVRHWRALQGSRAPITDFPQTRQ